MWCIHIAATFCEKFEPFLPLGNQVDEVGSSEILQKMYGSMHLKTSLRAGRSVDKNEISK